MQPIQHLDLLPVSEQQKAQLLELATECLLNNKVCFRVLAVENQEITVRVQQLAPAADVVFTGKELWTRGKERSPL